MTLKKILIATMVAVASVSATLFFYKGEDYNVRIGLPVPVEKVVYQGKLGRVTDCVYMKVLVSKKNITPFFASVDTSYKHLSVNCNASSYKHFIKNDEILFPRFTATLRCGKLRTISPRGTEFRTKYVCEPVGSGTQYNMYIAACPTEKH